MSQKLKTQEQKFKKKDFSIYIFSDQFIYFFGQTVCGPVVKVASIIYIHTRTLCCCSSKQFFFLFNYKPPCALCFNNLQSIQPPNNYLLQSNHRVLRHLWHCPITVRRGINLCHCFKQLLLTQKRCRPYTL